MQVYNVNVFGVLRCMHHAERIMRERTVRYVLCLLPPSRLCLG